MALFNFDEYKNAVNKQSRTNKFVYGAAAALNLPAIWQETEQVPLPQYAQTQAPIIQDRTQQSINLYNTDFDRYWNTAERAGRELGVRTSPAEFFDARRKMTDAAFQTQQQIAVQNAANAGNTQRANAEARSTAYNAQTAAQIQNNQATEGARNQATQALIASLGQMQTDETGRVDNLYKTGMLQDYYNRLAAAEELARTQEAMWSMYGSNQRPIGGTQYKVPNVPTPFMSNIQNPLWMSWGKPR